MVASLKLVRIIFLKQRVFGLEKAFKPAWDRSTSPHTTHGALGFAAFLLEVNPNERECCERRCVASRQGSPPILGLSAGYFYGHSIASNDATADSTDTQQQRIISG